MHTYTGVHAEHTSDIMFVSTSDADHDNNNDSNKPCYLQVLHDRLLTCIYYSRNCIDMQTPKAVQGMVSGGGWV